MRHTCDNPPCCNPEHLRGGTQRQNMNDARRRGRLNNWERSRQAKVDSAVVREIRSRYPHESCRELAEEYGIGERQVRRIVRYQAWSHVE